MKKLKYNNIEGLKQDYLSLFNINELQKEWITAREYIITYGGNPDAYPLDIQNLLVGSVECLAKLFYDYKKVEKANRNINKHLYNTFSFPKKISTISKFFLKHSNDINISTCHYCETAYINTYMVRNTQKRHFDLDHFFPKSECPILSLSLFNLIPCCPICNQRLKRSFVLGNNYQESVMLCPSSELYNFDKCVQFVVIPKNMSTKEIKGIRFLENAELFKVDLLSKSTIYKKEINMFHLDERYDFHKCEALRLLDLIRDYPSSHIKMIQTTLNCYTEQKISEDIFGKEFMQQYGRTFAKLTRDIMKLNGI